MLKRFGPVRVFAADSGAGSGSGSGAGSGSSPGGSATTAAPSSTPSTPSAPSAAPSSAPASTPSGKPAAPKSTDGKPSAPSGKPDSGAIDFDVFFGTAEPETGAEEIAQAAASLDEGVVVPPTAKPVVPPTAPEAAAQVPPVQPAAAPTGPQATTSQTPPLGGVDPADPMSLANALQENEQQAVDYIAEAMFKLTPADIEALETDVVGAVPKLLARTFVRAQQNFLVQMGRIIPQMIQRQSVLVQRNSENEGKFFARWPDLKAAEHSDIVRKYAVTYRRMHPQATMEQMMEDLGPMVMMAARVTPSLGPAGGSAVRGNGARQASPPPFVPAQGGPAASVKQVESQPWDILDPARE